MGDAIVVCDGPRCDAMPVTACTMFSADGICRYEAHGPVGGGLSHAYSRNAPGDLLCTINDHLDRHVEDGNYMQKYSDLLLQKVDLVWFCRRL